MRIRYPRSFFKLLSAGFLLAVLPLVVGLLANTVAIQRLAAQSQRAVYDAARVVHTTRELSETATSLERAAQQSVVLRDPTFWNAYLTLHSRFVEAGSELAALPLEAPMRSELDALLHLEMQLNDDLVKVGPKVKPALALARRHVEVSRATRELLTS